MIARDLEARWRALDDAVRTWWDGDLHRAGEAEVAADPAGTLLYLPHPYSSAAGDRAAFPEMYGWDTFFINLGLLTHGRADVARGHVLNQLYQVEQYGFVPNGNRSFYLTRSQPPMLGESVRRYVEASGDLDVATRALPALEREYCEFWDAPPRRTPTGLATNHDSGDPALRPELAAEAESGRDFTAIYGGDVRRCVPLHVNAALVRYARAIAWLAGRLGDARRAAAWQAEAERRAALVRRLCWSPREGTFLQYDWRAGTQLPHRSLCSLWVLWAGIATPEQAACTVADARRFLSPHGLAFTDRAYASPHPEFRALQWSHPAGWPPEQMVAVEALDAHGFQAHAAEVASRYLSAQVELHARTGELWEKLNVVTGAADVPLERYATPPFHGWASASVAVLGRRLFGSAARARSRATSPSAS